MATSGTKIGISDYGTVSDSWNRRKQRVKHSDFRNASTSRFMENLIGSELLDMVHGECVWRESLGPSRISGRW